MTPRRGLGAAVAVASVALVAGCSGGSSGPPSAAGSSAATTGAPSSPADASDATSSLSALQSAYTSLVKRTLPSVVEIRTSAGLGSGVVFDRQGDIVTNNHVVGSSTSFQVTAAGSSEALSAHLVGTYPPDDLAVIRVTGDHHLRPASFADSSKVAVGDIVLAMGSPLGLSSSVTSGIVSAVGRTVTEPAEQNSPGAVLPQVIQTSAPINPGNSGGALVDIRGEVVGVPTLAAVDQQIGQGGSAAPGIGFAIPSNVVTDIAGQLVKNGKVTNSHRAALGVTVVPLVNSAGNPAGVGVRSVQAGGAAARAGIRAGDVITSLDGQQVSGPTALRTVLAGLSVGQTVPVGLERNGSTVTVHVTLEQLRG